MELSSGKLVVVMNLIALTTLKNYKDSGYGNDKMK